MTEHKFPIQPLELDTRGVLRFVQNRIVHDLLNFGKDHGFGLNELACRPEYTTEEWMQFAQLIGYSLSGYGDLSYVSDDKYETADKMWRDKLTETEAELKVKSEKLDAARELVKDLAGLLFPICPEDLDSRY